MSVALGFDVYGTLVDPLRMERRLRTLFGDTADAMSALWRQKQLEYSFRRALMRRYENFDACTRRALSFVLETFKARLSDTAQQQLLVDYLDLPTFPDVKPALGALQASGCVMAAFSNGVESSLRTLLGNAGVLRYLQAVVSVDDLKTFKPNPDVYLYLTERVGRDPEDTWLISANTFDVIGAKAAGLKAAWVRRSPAVVFDPWEFQPDIIVSDLTELASQLKARLPHLLGFNPRIP
jgi:2-haloacid dehalogenase